jgi:hypothetical protein
MDQKKHGPVPLCSEELVFTGLHAFEALLRVGLGLGLPTGPSRTLMGPLRNDNCEPYTNTG